MLSLSLSLYVFVFRIPSPREVLVFNVIIEIPASKPNSPQLRVKIVLIKDTQLIIANKYLAA